MLVVLGVGGGGCYFGVKRGGFRELGKNLTKRSLKKQYFSKVGSCSWDVFTKRFRGREYS
jgi:hypothetical protein